MSQHHAMDIRVSLDGKLEVKVAYRDRIPDLVSEFPLAVQRRARRMFYRPNAYERQLWTAARTMPAWARETVRQHILHERALDIEARMKRSVDRKREWDARRQTVATTLQKVVQAGHGLARSARERLVPKTPVAVPTPVQAKVPLTVAAMQRHNALAETALRSAPARKPSLTEQLAREHGTPVAWSPPQRLLRDWSRGR